ncbi:universal stress protein [Halopelagius fulvigenes]|uniref:Universal stress protein n=1 Tax=Halopelagius fulvigenes TaxID=1198324 RepID=A0ABD5TVM6_9EURY
MSKHLLLPVDGSPQSVEALHFASSEWDDATVTLLHVIDPVATDPRPSALPGGSEEWYEEMREESEELLAKARAAFDDDADVRTRTEVGRPAQSIVSVAGDGEFDHIVMGSHGREGISRILLGSTAEYVVRRSPVPVTIVR